MGIVTAPFRHPKIGSGRCRYPYYCQCQLGKCEQSVTVAAWKWGALTEVEMMENKPPTLARCQQWGKRLGWQHSLDLANFSTQKADIFQTADIFPYGTAHAQTTCGLNITSCKPSFEELNKNHWPKKLFSKISSVRQLETKAYFGLAVMSRWDPVPWHCWCCWQHSLTYHDCNKSNGPGGVPPLLASCWAWRHFISSSSSMTCWTVARRWRLFWNFSTRT